MLGTTACNVYRQRRSTPIMDLPSKKPFTIATFYSYADLFIHYPGWLSSIRGHTILLLYPHATTRTIQSSSFSPAAHQAIQFSSSYSDPRILDS